MLDFGRARAVLAEHYSHTGRPSIYPELMLQMLLIGYAYGIRSERQPCNEVHLNLAYRWFCRLGLEGAVPERSTFSKNRYGRFRESDIYRVLFEELVEQCRKAGLVPGEDFAVDSSFVHGDARRDLWVESMDELRLEADLSARPVREHLVALDAGSPAHEYHFPGAGFTDRWSARKSKRYQHKDSGKYKLLWFGGCRSSGLTSTGRNFVA